MRLKRKLRIAFRLSRQEWILFAQTWLLLPCVDLALRVLPFKMVADWASVVSYASQRTCGDELKLAMTCWTSVDRAARNQLYPLTCLRRSLVLQKLLSWRGVGSDIRFGARREDERLEAHAWVEVRGQVVGETGRVIEQYGVLRTSEETA